MVRNGSASTLVAAPVAEARLVNMLDEERDPERGGAAAAKLKGLGVKGVLIGAAEQGFHHPSRLQDA